MVAVQQQAGAEGVFACTVCGALVDADELSLEEVSEVLRTPEVFLCQECMEESVLPGDAVIGIVDAYKWGPDA